MPARSYCPVGACRFVAEGDTLKQSELALRLHREEKHGDLRILPLLEAGIPTWSSFFPQASLPPIGPAVLLSRATPGPPLLPAALSDESAKK